MQWGRGCGQPNRVFNLVRALAPTRITYPSLPAPTLLYIPHEPIKPTNPLLSIRNTSKQPPTSGFTLAHASAAYLPTTTAVMCFLMVEYWHHCRCIKRPPGHVITWCNKPLTCGKNGAMRGQDFNYCEIQAAGVCPVRGDT